MIKWDVVEIRVSSLTSPDWLGWAGEFILSSLKVSGAWSFLTQEASHIWPAVGVCQLGWLLLSHTTSTLELFQSFDTWFQISYRWRRWHHPNATLPVLWVSSELSLSKSLYPDSPLCCGVERFWRRGFYIFCFAIRFLTANRNKGFCIHSPFITISWRKYLFGCLGGLQGGHLTMATPKFVHFRPLQKCVSNNGLISPRALEVSLPRAFSHVPKGTTCLQKSRFLKNIIFYFVSCLPPQYDFL